MKVLNNDYFNLMKEYNDSNLQNDLTDYECKCYANMFYVYSDITNNIYTFSEMLQTYDFITDVIDGKHPEVMIMTDKYRDIFRLLKRYSLTKRLDEDIRKKLAFLIFQAKCIVIIKEDTDKTTWNLGIFEEGTESFLEKYEFEIENYPSVYEIKEPLSNPDKDNFGLDKENPIEVISIPAEYEYLSLLLTKDGKRITYKRVGSTIHSDGTTYIDIYDIYVKKLFKNKNIATIYISGYGNDNTLVAPKGFRLMTLDEIKNNTK